MAVQKNESKILVFGGTGYIGSYVVKASIKLGHPTYVFSRPNSNKTEMLNQLQSNGLDQLKIIEAIKVALLVIFKISAIGTLVCEEDRVSVFASLRSNSLRRRGEIRRALKQQNIPYNFSFLQTAAVLTLSQLLAHPDEQTEEIITVYGSGEAKEYWRFHYQQVAIDPRACNRVVIYRPAADFISQLELISLWEKKTGRSFNKVHLAEAEMVTLSETLPDPQNIPISILHSVFVNGVTANFELGENDVEASALYPDLKVTSVDELLDIFLSYPPKPANAAFA
ncbi:Eugenol synthase 1 [Sesamum angolense]|uniref:Eugenol synthase 1 n=1 Tax=Sesamum angolense TaxID=2727404 RepID=A0AAE1WDC7_9LAMI|nr:Eugenol synthase 1 [Sesamum angolense]